MSPEAAVLFTVSSHDTSPLDCNLIITHLAQCLRPRKQPNQKPGESSTVGSTRTRIDLSIASLAPSDLRSRGPSAPRRVVRCTPTSGQHGLLAYHYYCDYYCDRYDWLGWAGLGMMASSIGPAVKPPLLLFAFSSALDDFRI